jgi:hypothetical protein
VAVTRSLRYRLMVRDGHLDRGALGHGVDRVVDTLERQPDGDQIVDRHLAGGDHRESPLVVVRARAVRPTIVSSR